jgi:2'-5' RNA ligase
MSRIAVDVVLLPDEEMTDRVAGINAELVKQGNTEIVLSKECCLPHISIAMGCIDEADISKIEKMLAELVRQRPIQKLVVYGVFTSINKNGDKVSVYIVEKTEQLQKLHEEVMNRMAKYTTYEAKKEMIYGYPEETVAEGTLLWINNYREKASSANFLPHITVGYGVIPTPEAPIEFGVSSLALCHLGNHCTCRRILTSVDL